MTELQVSREGKRCGLGAPPADPHLQTPVCWPFPAVAPTSAHLWDYRDDPENPRVGLEGVAGSPRLPFPGQPWSPPSTLTAVSGCVPGSPTPRLGVWEWPTRPASCLAAVSPVAGADPDAWLLSGPVRAWLGVRVFGEEGFLPEPGQVSPAWPGAWARGSEGPRWLLWLLQVVQALLRRGWVRQDGGVQPPGLLPRQGALGTRLPADVHLPQVCVWGGAATQEGSAPSSEDGVPGRWGPCPRDLSRCLCAFVSPQVLGFADELPAYAQHLLFALCHFLLLGLGDSQSLLRPGVWAGGPGAAGLLTAPRRGKGAAFPPRPGASGSAGGTAVALLPLSSAFPSRRRRWGPGTTQAPRRCSRCSERAGGAGWTCTAAWRTPGTGAAPCCCGVRSRPRPGPCP